MHAHTRRHHVSRVNPHTFEEWAHGIGHVATTKHELALKNLVSTQHEPIYCRHGMDIIAVPYAFDFACHPVWPNPPTLVSTSRRRITVEVSFI